MLCIVQTETATELNWMWLPSWIGMNRHLQEKMQQALGERLVGKTLEQAHEIVLDWLQEVFPQFKGMRLYLEGLMHLAPEGAENMSRTERLQLRIDPEIKLQIKELAEERGVGLSALVEGYFRDLLVQAERMKAEAEHIDAEQI